MGPVYDDGLSMAWVFLELIVKSMALQQSRTCVDNLPLGKSQISKLQGRVGRKS